MSAEIVIDVGCADHGPVVSIRHLIDRFQPRVLFGFDPAANARRSGYRIGGTRVEISKAAAWTYDGEARMWGSRSRATLIENIEDGPGETVETIDIARFIEQLDEPVILKLDCEGAEYIVLGHLIARNALRHVERVLVEWHHLDRGTRPRERDTLERVLAAEGIPVEEWEW